MKRKKKTRPNEPVLDKKTGLALLVLLLSPLVFGVTNPEALAAPFLTQAIDLDGLGKTEEALAWINRGLELHPESSDLSFLKARLIFASSKPGADRLLSSALSWSNFKQYRLQEASALFGQVLRLQRRYDEAAAHLMGLWTTSDILNDRGLLQETVRLRAAMGLPGQARALLDRGMKVHPSDLYLKSLYLELYETAPLDFALLVDRSKAEAPGYTTFLKAYARTIRPGEERLAVLGRLKELKSLDPWSAWLMVEDKLDQGSKAGGGQDEGSLVKEFVALGGLVDADGVLALRSKLTTDEGIVALQSALTIAPLVVTRDHGRDGFVEERYRLVNGSLASWSLDHDQDGFEDYLSLWQEGSPVALILHDSQRRRYYRSEYGALYPYAGRTLLNLGPGVIEFMHDYRALEERFVDLPGQGLDVFATLALAYNPQVLPQEEEYLRASYQLNIYPLKTSSKSAAPVGWASTFIPLSLPLPYETGNESYSPRDFEIGARVLAQYRLEEGVPVAGRVDEDLNGEFDHGFVYDRGRAIFGYRDPSGGDEPIVVEEFGEDGISRIVQSTGAWTYELQPASGIALWDLDNDGRVDVREFRSAAGRVWQAFSTRGDGNFDLLLDGSR